MYTIVMPGMMHRALDLLGVFEEDVPEDAVRAFREGVHRQRGKGTQVTVTGSRKAVQGVLAVLKKMADEADDGIISVRALGSNDMRKLRAVSRQPLQRAV